MSTLRASPRGLLRVTAPTNFRALGPIVHDYLQRYPDVRVELFCTGRRVDLVEERFDLGVRAGPLADSSLIARSLGTAGWLLVAAPSYLRRRGRPKSPKDLAKHEMLTFGANTDVAHVILTKGDETRDITLSPRLVVSDNDILHQVTLAGLGIGLLPSYLCVDDVRARRLERLLPQWNAPSTPVHVVYPSTRHMSAKVKTFVDHLQSRVTATTW